MPKQPQDHLPAKGQPFTFTAKGKTYTLPPAELGREAMTGRDFRDAVMGGEATMLAYTFKILEAAKPDKAALDALYSLPQVDMLNIVTAWGNHDGGGSDGAGVGESPRSSA